MLHPVTSLLTTGHFTEARHSGYYLSTTCCFPKLFLKLTINWQKRGIIDFLKVFPELAIQSCESCCKLCDTLLVQVQPFSIVQYPKNLFSFRYLIKTENTWRLVIDQRLDQGHKTEDRPEAQSFKDKGNSCLHGILFCSQKKVLNSSGVIITLRKLDDTFLYDTPSSDENNIGI